MNAKLLFLMLMLSAIPATAQTVAEIEKTYGKPMLAYSVTEHIWMTPEFAADGQVCSMRFYPKRVYRETAYLGGHLVFNELKWILNSIAPPSSRGKRALSYGLSDFGGGILETNYEYEKVNFTFIDSMRIHFTPETLNKLGEYVGFDFDASIKIPEPPPPSENDFDNSTKTQIVVLRWKNRTCAKGHGSVQAVAALEQQFGQPQKIYSVARFMSMRPGFAAGGQLCKMWLYPKRVSEDSSVLGTKLEFGEVREFLNVLVPPEERGLKELVNFGSTATGAGLAWTTYPYERISFTFMLGGDDSSKAPSAEAILKRGEFVFTIPYEPSTVVEQRIPSVEDFRREDNIEIIAIRWPHRKCIE